MATLRRLALALLVLGVLFATGACSSQPDLQEGAVGWSQAVVDGIGETVQDPERRGRALEIGSELQAQIASFYAMIEQGRTTLFALNRDYDATREQLDDALAHVRSEREAHADRLTVLAVELRGVMTPDEWAAYAKTMDAYRADP